MSDFKEDTEYRLTELEGEVLDCQERLVDVEKDVALLKKIPKDFTAKDLNKLIDLLSANLEEFKRMDKEVLRIKGMYEGLKKMVVNT